MTRCWEGNGEDGAVEKFRVDGEVGVQVVVVSHGAQCVVVEVIHGVIG